MLFGLSIGLMVFFAVMLVLERHTIRQGQAFNAALSIDVNPHFIQPDFIDNLAPVNIEPVTVEQESAVAIPLMDFESKRETLPYIVAWIHSEGTVINYPIVQGNDNEYYLSRLPDGSRNSIGSIFLDYRNDFSDDNIMIYGHNMRSGDMFGSFRHYTNQDYFERHPCMSIFTPTHNFTLLLFAGYIFDSSVEVPPMSFGDSDEFERYISNIKSRSIFTSDIDAEFGDKIAFLCTCTESGSKHERLVIVGKLLETENEAHI